MNLMVTNAPRVLEYLMKNLPERMIQYIDSQSIAEFFVRIIVVEDPLINNQIKERIQLLNTLIDIYAKN